MDEISSEILIQNSIAYFINDISSCFVLITRFAIYAVLRFRYLFFHLNEAYNNHLHLLDQYDADGNQI
jgi:hypothetical protein